MAVRSPLTCSESMPVYAHIHAIGQPTRQPTVVGTGVRPVCSLPVRPGPIKGAQERGVTLCALVDEQLIPGVAQVEWPSAEVCLRQHCAGRLVIARCVHHRGRFRRAIASVGVESFCLRQPPHVGGGDALPPAECRE
eukprot:scaffold5667_cov68-Phaeocystis_antarctica.AAC.7